MSEHPPLSALPHRMDYAAQVLERATEREKAEKHAQGTRFTVASRRSRMTTSLPARMRAAAATLTEVSLLYGYRWPDEQAWSPAELRHEAAVIEIETPATHDWDNCAGHVYSEDNT